MTHLIIFFFFFFFFFIIFAAAAPSYDLPYAPLTTILLNCGATTPSNDTSNRQWRPDTHSTFSPSLTSPGLTSPSLPDAPQVPFLTSRIFSHPFTYSFPLAPSRVFLRLYFYPSPTALFSLTAGPTTLLHNFSAAQTAAASTAAYLILEFSLTVSSSPLNLTFTPSPASHAFVNGIEIVSIPNLIPTAPLNGAAFAVDDNTALQTVYRLNVGGQAVSPAQDSGLFRAWADDSIYIYGAGIGVSYASDPNVSITYSPATPLYVAPSDVYSTARSMGPTARVNINYNLTWIFNVDAGFRYLIRFHFCEIQYPITKINQRVFNIYVNNQTAYAGADVIAWSGGIGRPVYEDYVVFMAGSGQMDLWVALHPDAAAKPQMYDAILNGLEIFKLQNSNLSLAGPNPSLPPQLDVDPSRIWKTNKSKIKTPAITGGVIAGAFTALVLLLVCFLLLKKKKKGESNGAKERTTGWLPVSLYSSENSIKTATTGNSSSDPSNLCRHFSFAEIEAATNGFDEALLLGVGGFGKVYRGEIKKEGGSSMKVAIKRGNTLSGQGAHEFQTEIEMLSKLRHRHLVSLIGFCEEKNEMILVYDYMAQGTLREHLYKTEKPPLPWKQRLEICIGAARGLHYLHTGAKYTIIHRDVKTTNILLDENWVAKVSDFGLSKTGPMLDHTHVSTVVKGSFGYLDPEYFRRQQLSEKSDVYSFGVVLFEVLCARPALNTALAKEEVSLAEWALHCQKKGVLDQIMDPFLKGKIDPQCFKNFAETAEKCLAENGGERPAMGDVLWNLEFALQLQDSVDENVGMMGGGISEGEGALVVPSTESGSAETAVGTGMGTGTTTTTMSIGGRSLGSEEADELTPSALFSQIINPEGR